MQYCKHNWKVSLTHSTYDSNLYLSFYKLNAARAYCNTKLRCRKDLTRRGIIFIATSPSDKTRGNGFKLRQGWGLGWILEEILLLNRCGIIRTHCPGKSPSLEVFKKSVDLELSSMVGWTCQY